MDDYLVKPVELSQILKKLDQWLPIHAHDSVSDTVIDTFLPAPTAEQSGVFDPSVLVAISGVDAATVREILWDYRRASVEDIAMLQQAVANQDTVQATRAVHRIRGASQTISPIGLAAVCARLEDASRSNDWATVLANMGAFEHEWTAKPISRLCYRTNLTKSYRAME